MKLQILANDILTTKYADVDDCAITRALERAGLKGYKDKGLKIVDEEGRDVVDHNDGRYKELCDTVVRMYLYQTQPDNELRLEPKDFEADLPLEKATA